MTGPPRQTPPNNALQLTAYSVRCAPASGSSLSASVRPLLQLYAFDIPLLGNVSCMLCIP